MICLLDTHSLLWAVTAPGKLSARMRRVITDPGNEIHVSTVSFWEISLKVSIGKLEMTGCSPEDVVSSSRQMGLTISAPTAEESAGFYRLPRVAHKDPFERMLIWQCLQRQWTLITRDRNLTEYGPLGLHTTW
jgi:PIN domain nuclease of toxin-antitoxin system